MPSVQKPVLEQAETAKLETVQTDYGGSISIASSPDSSFQTVIVADAW